MEKKNPGEHLCILRNDSTTMRSAFSSGSTKHFFLENDSEVFLVRLIHKTKIPITLMRLIERKKC